MKNDVGATLVLFFRFYSEDIYNCIQNACVSLAAHLVPDVRMAGALMVVLRGFIVVLGYVCRLVLCVGCRRGGQVMLPPAKHILIPS